MAAKVLGGTTKGGAVDARSRRPPRGAFRPHPVGGGFSVPGPLSAGSRAIVPRSPWHGQKVSFQLLIRPVSAEATSWTRSFQVPLAVSPDASTV